jgi:hypothetical protein
MKDENDCDIFEVAQELYAALTLAEHTLNQIKNTRISAGGYRNSYEVAARIGKTLREYEDRI